MTSTSPKIAARQPQKLTLKKNKKYFWCSCGQSKNQPYCDGSHRGTNLQPIAFEVEEEKDYYLCMCKHTQNQPFCDGTHSRLNNIQQDKFNSSTLADRTPENAGTPSATPTEEEPTVAFIHQLAREGLEKEPHGPLDAMGVPRNLLPHWDDIQILPGQLATKPLLEETEVSSELILGPRAKKPLVLKMPLLVSDMSFGALSEEAKIALAKGAELAGTAICSGEGGMLPEEQQENSRYLYELASAKFGFTESLLTKIQSFHFKAGQGAKTGIGGHLPSNKVVGKIAKVRGLPEHQPAVSPPSFCDLSSPKDFKKFGDRVREVTGGIPIGFKISANHIEKDIEFALLSGADYIILDGRGGGTGAAPRLFRDHISVPTIPALARARRFLNKNKSWDVTLIITGGLRVPSDFVKALCLGADGIALANSAIQAVGCIAARICHTNLCPSGVATQDPELRRRINVETSAQQLNRFLKSSVDLMKMMARACGHDNLNQFNLHDIGSYKKEMAELSGVFYTGY